VLIPISSQLSAVMSNLGQNLSKEEINEMMKAADLDGNGTIDFNEFKLMMGGRK